MAEAAKKPKPLALDVQVSNYFTSRRQSGVEGLALLDKCIRRVAEHRDWDALSRFVVGAMPTGNRSKVVRIIGAAFGQRLTFKTDKKHPTGGSFVMGWEGAFPLKGSNTYTAVTEAIKKGMGWDEVAFIKELPKADKKPRTVSDEAEKKVVKHLLAYLAQREAEGFSTGTILADVQKELVAKKASKSADVEKKVVNGVTVFEPSF